MLVKCQVFRKFALKLAESNLLDKSQPFDDYCNENLYVLSRSM